MLGLRAATHEGWIEAVNANLASLLIDHVHAEKKAALTALSLINRYPESATLVTKLTAMAREELDHLAQMHAIVIKRGIVLTRDAGDEYARALQSHCRKVEPEKMLDSLIIAALIEARSCERFTILSKKCADKELREVFAGLLGSEAGHYTLFLDLARQSFPADTVKQRLQEFLEIEAGIVMTLPNKPLMHG